jgi:hypothetical protein
MQRARLPYLLIPLAAFLAILPLLIKGCSCGHDFDFHLLSWMEAARQFTHGNLHPHWAYTPAYNAGEPRFVFYPPLSWMIGAILGLLFPWTWTPTLYTWLALAASGLALHRLARDFTSPTAALIAAVVYTVNPYMLFTAYERTAYAELLAAAWIPLLLHAILRKQVTIPGIAIPIALLWLTNAPAAVMSCYALALLTALRLVYPFTQINSLQSNSFKPTETVISTEANHSLIVSHAVEKSASLSLPPNASTQTRLQLALNTTAGTALGLSLAAFYILPAAYERRYVQIAMAIIPNMRIQDNFLFHHTGDAPHDQVLHTASLIAVILITLTAATLTILYTRHPSAPNSKLTTQDSEEKASSRPQRSGVERPHFASPAGNSKQTPTLWASLTTLTIAITLLLTPITTIIWTHAPELAFLQFPWRLTAILAAVLALATSIALTKLNLKPISITALTLALAAALTYPAYAAFHQPCGEEDTVQARLNLFQSNQGAEPTDEYTPTNADNDSLALTNPPYWLSPHPNAKAPANASPGPAPTHFSIEATQPGFLILNLRDYPSWDVTTVDPNRMELQRPEHMQRDDGLISLRLDYAANYTIDITYTQSVDQTLGNMISLVTLAILLFMLFRKSRKISSGPFSS